MIVIGIVMIVMCIVMFIGIVDVFIILHLWNICVYIIDSLL